MVIGGEKSNQANNAAKDGFQQGLAVKPQPPPGWRRSQVPRKATNLKQSSPLTTLVIIVHTNSSSKSRWGSVGGRRCTSLPLVCPAAV